jgi:hypothetical protein
LFTFGNGNFCGDACIFSCGAKIVQERAFEDAGGARRAAPIAV